MYVAERMPPIWSFRCFTWEELECWYASEECERIHRSIREAVEEMGLEVACST